MTSDRQGRARASRTKAAWRDAAFVLGLVALAFGTVAAVAFTHVRRTDPAPPGPRAAPDSVVPDRVPYADLVHGDLRELEDGRIELRYDFDPKPRVEGRPFTEDDLYPQLRDWNMSLEGSRARAGVVRGEGRLTGEARTRLAFAGSVEVEVDLEIRAGRAAIQIDTNTHGEGYECLITDEGEVRLRARKVTPKERAGFDDIATLSEREKEKGGTEVVTDLAGPVRLDAPAAGRRLRVRFARTEDRLRVEIGGKGVEEPVIIEAPLIIETPLGEPDPWPEGNVALRSPGRRRGGRALWDDVRITGRLSAKWLEEAMDVATRLTGPDYYEPDDAWAMARELAADGTEQIRTTSPEGDVDWITVAVPEGAEAVKVETSDLRLGISTEICAFELDGRTPMETEARSPAEPGAAGLVVGTEGRSAFYVRLTEPEGRRGTYRILAVPVGPAESP